MIFCTGYKMDVPFLADDIRDTVLDQKNNAVKVFK